MNYYKNLSLQSLFYINDDGLICQEEWKYVSDYENFYQVSDLGRMKSLDRIDTTKGDVLKKTKGKILSQTLKRNGYLSIMLCVKNKRKRFHPHRLLAVEFIENPENKPEINHKDSIKVNNLKWNLEWNTKEENRNHANLNGLIKKGELVANSKLTDLKVIALRRLYKMNPNFNKLAIARKLNVGDSTIHRVIRNKRWKHVH